MIETERLMLRKPRSEDAADLADAYSDPEGGRGYATEAARALRNRAFEARGLSRLSSLIDPANVRSIPVAERIGERYERDVEVRGKPTRLYSLAR